MSMSPHKPRFRELLNRSKELMTLASTELARGDVDMGIAEAEKAKAMKKGAERLKAVEHLRKLRNKRSLEAANKAKKKMSK